MKDPIMLQIDRHTDPKEQTYTTWIQFRIDGIEAVDEQAAIDQAHDIVETVFPDLIDDGAFDVEIHAVEEGE